MADKVRVFISYKTGVDDGMTARANSMRRALLDRYNVWMMDEIIAGLEWNKQIYEQIPQSDALLLLLAEKTAESNWVRREVDVARGARVTILPIWIQGNFDVEEMLEHFDLQQVQYVACKKDSDAEYADVRRSIDRIAGETRKRQRQWLEVLVQGEAPPKAKTPFAPTTQRFRTFRVEEQMAVRVHLAAGDMLAMRNIDVMVNSENDYMQMGRIFESKTISALLRYYGSLTNPADRTAEDTLQDELNTKIAQLNLARPVGTGMVITTSAGHPQSKLRTRNKVRYVFHTATVSVQGQGIHKRLEAVQVEFIGQCVINTLQAIWEVDDAMGRVSPQGTLQRQQQEEGVNSYQSVRSIMMPLFGSGHGGRPVEQTAPAMVHGVKEFLTDIAGSRPLALEDIYLCAFFKEDADCLEQALRQEFIEQPGTGSQG